MKAPDGTVAAALAEARALGIERLDAQLLLAQFEVALVCLPAIRFVGAIGVEAVLAHADLLVLGLRV